MAKCETCGKEYHNTANLRRGHYNNGYQSHVPDNWDKCPSCDKYYETLGSHWSHNPGHIPKLTNKQHEIVKGVLMSDGWIHTNKNSSLQITSTTKEYLEYLDNEFGVLTTGVHFKESAEEAAEKDRNSGFNSIAKGENYNDKYTVRTRNIPELNQYREWYDSGEKVWPENIEITPTLLKHLYVCDGSINRTKDKRPIIRISAGNEYNNTEKLKNYFEKIGYSPYFQQGEDNRMDIIFSVDESERLWEYMGDPLPGFEYKWPEG